LLVFHYAQLKPKEDSIYDFFAGTLSHNASGKKRTFARYVNPATTDKHILINTRSTEYGIMKQKNSRINNSKNKLPIYLAGEMSCISGMTCNSTGKKIQSKKPAWLVVLPFVRFGGFLPSHR